MNIVVVPYSPDWPNAFAEEKRALEEILGSVADEIHHIGSTAVEGIAAKPIIDIMIEASSIEGVDKSTKEIEALGYEAKGEFGIAGRRYFRKSRDERTHQIHAYQTGDPNILRHVAFRDYLKAHANVRKQYQELKIKVAADCQNDMGRYCDGKDQFVRIHEAKALEWLKLNSEQNV
jgi:GrpB-like predicted nucleotidyltransferase (UPF0157 family)